MLGKNLYLHKNAEGKVQLMSNHSYYYQVQTQLLVTGFKFCDFFVWTDKDTFLETTCVDTEIQHFKQNQVSILQRSFTRTCW